MKTCCVIHASEARLGRPEPGISGRATDRFTALEHVLDTALRASADAIVLSGMLLDPPEARPELIADLETLLGRARAARCPVVAHAEEPPRGWSKYLVDRGLLSWLAPSSRSSDPLPTFESRRQLRLVALGAPPSAAELARRLGLLEAAPGGSAASVALLDLRRSRGPAIQPSLELVERLARSAAFVALGTSPEPRALAPNACDPGPLTRLDVDADAAEPGFSRIQIAAGRGRAERVSSGDRPLLVARADASGVELERGLEASLRAQLEGRLTDGRALLRIDVTGTLEAAARPPDERKLLAVAERLTGPGRCRVRYDFDLMTSHGERVRPDTPRAAIEKAVLARLLGDAPSEIAPLAHELLDSVLGPESQTFPRAEAALARYLGSAVLPAESVPAALAEALPTPRPRARKTVARKEKPRARR